MTVASLHKLNSKFGAGKSRPSRTTLQPKQSIFFSKMHVTAIAADQVHVPKAGGKDEMRGLQIATGTPVAAREHALRSFLRMPKKR